MDASLVRVDGARGIEACQQLTLGGEQHIVVGANGGVAEGLRDVGLSGAAWPGDEGLVDGGIEVEVELLERLGGAEPRAADAQVGLLVLASGDFVGDEQGQEVGMGDLVGDGLTVTSLERVEDPGQTQSPANEGSPPCRVGACWNVAPGAVFGLEGTRGENAAETPATSATVLRTQLRW